MCVYVSAFGYSPHPGTKGKVQIMIPNDRQLLASKKVQVVMYVIFYIRTVHPRSYCLVDTHIFFLVLLSPRFPLLFTPYFVPKCAHWPIPMGLACIGGHVFPFMQHPVDILIHWMQGEGEKTSMWYTMCWFPNKLLVNHHFPIYISLWIVTVDVAMIPFDNPAAIEAKQMLVCDVYSEIRAAQSFNLASDTPTRQLHE